MDLRRTRKSLDTSFESCSTQERSPQVSERLGPVKPPKSSLNALALRQRSADILEALNHLFSEFHKHFVRRKNTWIALKAPYEALDRYSLRLDRSYRNALLAQAQEIQETPAQSVLVNNINSTFGAFIQSLAQALQSMRQCRRLLAVICVNEAYATVANATNVVMQIVKPIHPHLLEVVCKQFFEVVLNEHTYLLEYANNPENSHWATQELIQIFKKQQWELESSSEEESVQEILQKLSIEDLVSFINAGSQKKQKKKKKKQVLEDDTEIEMFRERLERVQPLAIRLKPMLSEEFLYQLKQHLQALDIHK